MAMRVRQLVPMVGSDGVRFAGRVYVTDDAEAGRLEAAGFAEVLERGLADAEILAVLGDVEIPEDSMSAAAATEVAAPHYDRQKKDELVALAVERGLDAGGTKVELVARLEAADAAARDTSEEASANAEGSDTNAGDAPADDNTAGETAGGDSEQPPA